MPPVLGPVSPSPTRLWSCAADERERVLAVDECEEARLLACEEFLDDDLAARLAESAGEARVDRRLGLGPRRGDRHALAGGETVGLDDDRQLFPSYVRLGARSIREATIGRGWNIELGAQILGEALRALELCCRLLRPEALDPRRREIIYQSGHQRRFWSDDDEIDGVVLAEADHRGVVADGDAGRTRRPPQFRRSRAHNRASLTAGWHSASRRARARGRRSR